MSSQEEPNDKRDDLDRLPSGFADLLSNGSTLSDEHSDSSDSDIRNFIDSVIGREPSTSKIVDSERERKRAAGPKEVTKKEESVRVEDLGYEEAKPTAREGKLKEDGKGPERPRLKFIDDNKSQVSVMSTISRENSWKAYRREARLKSSLQLGTIIDFLKDPPEQMTYGRRIALHLMKTKKWYNPRLGEEEVEIDHEEDEFIQEEKPKLEKAWAYFEHVSLARYVFVPKKNFVKKKLMQRIINKFSKADKELARAEPGEAGVETRLYDPLFTPHKQLGDWGLGIGLYFSTLRILTLITFICGIINIPNMVYFASDEYSNGQQGLPYRLTRGSAICTETRWVPCEDCLDRTHMPDYRLASAEINGETRIFALENLCNGATYKTGFVNFSTVFVFIVGFFFMNKYLDWIKVKFDEDEQTTQDYSMRIKNPPGDATDPEEWRAYFADGFGATLSTCTVGLNNDLLVRTLVERRITRRKIELSLPPGTSLDTLNLANIAAQEENKRRTMGRIMAAIIPGIPELFGKLVVLTAKVQGLAQQGYPASNVFVTFETEADQRKVLSALSVGTNVAKRNDPNAYSDPKHFFRGKYVLRVEEADEPSTIRWQDINEKFKHRIKQQLLTTLCTCVSILVIAFIIQIVNNTSTVFSAYAIAIFNAAFPQFAKILTKFESHPSEGGMQTSLYFKIALFRWVNTAIVLTIIRPFVDTLFEEDGLIGHVYQLFFAEIVTTNAVQLADPTGHFFRHVLAPRAKTQDAMNLKFRGLEMELAERYTNMTKIVFLTVWYCAIFPGAFFLCSFTLFINYFTDKFSLMRTWKRPPQLDDSISQFSRRYFFSLAMVALAVISSYYWSGFPFDHLCETESTVNSTLVGTYDLTPLDPTYITPPISAKVGAGDYVYMYCNQDFLRTLGNSFPFTSDKQDYPPWMTDDQERLTDVYGHATLAVVIFVGLMFIYRFFDGFQARWRSTYDPSGEDQHINFSDVPSINAYVPEVKTKVYSYPLLACSIENIDPELLEWTDPDRPHSFYDLTRDAARVLRGMDVGDKVVFSQIKHWPADETERPTLASENPGEEEEAKSAESLSLPS